MTLDSRTRWLALLIVCLGDLMIVLDVTIVGVALAVDPRGPRVLGDVVGMGRECVSAHLRRVPAARRTARRPLRAPAPLHRRDRALHGRFFRVRARRLAGCVDRRTGRAGSRRRGRLGCRSLADRDALHRARRAREGDGRLRVRRGRRRLDRRAARRDHHGRARLELDLPRQRPDRHRGRRVLAHGASRRERRGLAGATRRRRCDHGDGVADGRGLRDRQRERGRLGDDADARVARCRRCAAGAVPLHRVARRGAARAARALPAAQPRRLERRRRALGRGDVRVVLPLRALSPARARLQPARRSGSRSSPGTSSWPCSRSASRRDS